AQGDGGGTRLVGGGNDENGAIGAVAAEGDVGRRHEGGVAGGCRDDERVGWGFDVGNREGQRSDDGVLGDRLIGDRADGRQIVDRSDGDREIHVAETKRRIGHGQADGRNAVLVGQ